MYHLLLSISCWVSVRIEASEDRLAVRTVYRRGRTAIICWNRDAANNITRNTSLQLHEYFNGERQVFDSASSHRRGSTFQQNGMERTACTFLLVRTDTYGAIAHKLNNPLSVRAVGTANGQNPIAIIIPCHRCIGAAWESSIGYAGGPVAQGIPAENRTCRSAVTCATQTALVIIRQPFLSISC